MKPLAFAAVLAIVFLAACSEPAESFGTRLREKDFILSERVTVEEAKAIEKRLGSTESEWERVPYEGGETGPGLVLLDGQYLDYVRYETGGIRMSVSYRYSAAEDSIYTAEYSWYPMAAGWEPPGEDTTGLQARFDQLYDELSEVFLANFHQPLDSICEFRDDGGFQLPIDITTSGDPAKACGHYYFGKRCAWPSLSIELHFY